MVHEFFPSGRPAQSRSRRRLLTAALVALSMSPGAYFVDFSRLSEALPEAHAVDPAVPAGAPASVRHAALDPALVAPSPVMAPAALALGRNAPLEAAFRLPQSSRPGPMAQPMTVALAVEPAQELPAQSTQPTPVPIPLPVPRPAEFRTARPMPAPQTASMRPASRPMAQAAVPASAPEDNRSFFEKLFGIRPAAPPEGALSYAALDRGTGSIAPTARFGPMPEAAGAGTAVYDIVAQTLTLPNGERLEAHSGLGAMMDDPRYVNVRMKGATPPGTYIVTEREALFHGVRALRLTPVGGSAAIYGRDGILAHPYLLGPRGDSNGCVSLKNYDRLLQAYLRGEVKRLVVTAGRGQDLVPRLASRPAVKNS